MNSSSARILFLVTGRQSPAARFRVVQNLTFFRQMGYEVAVRYGHGHHYNRVLRTPLELPYKIAGCLRRVGWTISGIRGYDLVFLQRLAIPHFAGPELCLAATTSARVVYDFDDLVASGANERRSLLRARAFHSITARADHVVAGNEFLAAQCARPDKTTVIPTGIDVRRYAPASRPASPLFIVGWMGTVHNVQRLRVALPDIVRFLDATPLARFRLVSNFTLEEVREHPQVEQLSWSESTEIDQLRSFDVGLMPLDDSNSARGKCAFKLLQYMAVGVPFIATDIGMNSSLDASQGGVLVKPGASWLEPLRELHADAALRSSFAEHGRRFVCEHYAAEKIAARYREVFSRLLHS